VRATALSVGGTSAFLFRESTFWKVFRTIFRWLKRLVNLFTLAVLYTLSQMATNYGPDSKLAKFMIRLNSFKNPFKND
jgi:hypothetical protein